ncbi:hypothetical protein IKF81_01720 [Candidatus Saccharibacteria bacterium]|nr:hypothetical protein [Candidatus Saccharibacteria bacterium]
MGIAVTVLFTSLFSAIGCRIYLTAIGQYAELKEKGEEVIMPDKKMVFLICLAMFAYPIGASLLMGSTNNKIIPIIFIILSVCLLFMLLPSVITGEYIQSASAYGCIIPTSLVLLIGVIVLVHPGFIDLCVTEILLFTVLLCAYLLVDMKKKREDE